MGYDLINLKYFPVETRLREDTTLEFKMKGNSCFFLLRSPNPFLTVFKPAALDSLAFLFLFFFHCVYGDRNYLEGEGGKREGNGWAQSVTLLRWTDMGESRGQTSSCTTPQSEPPRRGFWARGGKPWDQSHFSLGFCAPFAFCCQETFPEQGQKKSLQTLPG